MDLSHMVGLWLVGQGPGVGPGGVGVVYAPDGDDHAEGSVVFGKRVSPGWVYPFSVGRLGLMAVAVGTPSGVSASTGENEQEMRAGVGFVGELEYGPEGLSGFVPRLWAAVNMPAPMSLSPASVRTQEFGRGDENPLLPGVNRAADSIGLSDRLQFVDQFDVGGVLGRARVVGFIEREKRVTQVCTDVAVVSFPVMFGKLVDYLRFQVAAQVEANGYDDLAGVLAKSDRPTHAVMIAGLASAVPGIRCPLEPGDVCHSVVYDPRVQSVEGVRDALLGGDIGRSLNVEGVSWLRQEVN